MLPPSFTRLSALLTICVLLVACGGGSGGGSSSKFDTGTGFNYDEVDSIAIANDGSDDVYVAGNFYTYNGTARNHIARLNSDGSLDTGFDPGQGTDGPIFVVIATNDGSDDIYIAGQFTTYDGVSSNGIARVHSDGSLDTSFVVGTGFNNDVSCLAIATDGSDDVYAGGTFSSYNGTTAWRIIRLNSDGSVDSGFSTGSGFDVGVTVVKPTTDGSGDIYAAGPFTTYRGNNRHHLARINSDGSNDGGFTTPGNGPDDDVYALELAGDGSGDVYIGGRFSHYNGYGVTHMARIHSDGTYDLSFNGIGGFDGYPSTLVAIPDGTGRIYVGGDFSSYRGNSQSRIAILYSDGSDDGSFSTGTGFDSGGYINTIARRNDGSGDIYAGGFFSSYRSATAIGIIRLNSSGSPD